MEDIIKITQKLDKMNYFNCSMYYLKRYLGLREIILVALLGIIGIWLFLTFDLIIILIFFGITVLLILIAVGLFLITAILGYKHDFERQKICYHQMEFLEDKMVVTSLKIGGEPVFSEEHKYDKIEKIAIKRNKIYIYAGVAIVYYITLESMKETSPEVIADFLKAHLNAGKFKMKKTVKMFPKKAKVTIGDDDKKE